MSLKVKLYKGFFEDKRFSSEIYSEAISNYIKKSDGLNIKISSFRPIIKLSKYLPTKLKFRTARYIEYPYQINKIKNTGINHILEQGYAHLIRYPLQKQRNIVTVHDIIPYLAWKNIIPNSGYPHRPRLAEYSYSSLKHATHIIAVSKNTKKDLIKYCGCSEEKITVIHLGYDKSFRPCSKKKKFFKI